MPANSGEQTVEQRLTHQLEKASGQAEFCAIAYTDLEYLLARLYQLETALEQIAKGPGTNQEHRDRASTALAIHIKDAE